jgi:dihydrodipicolinate synthase/N-acetylneuraminate lyase
MFRRFAPLASAVLITSSLLISGCDGSVRREGRPQAELEVVRVDLAHNRRWVLRKDELTVYDHMNGRRLRHIVLPDWVVAGPNDACAPDMVLDASGAVFVSSNVLPVLWRIDAQRFQVIRIALQLDADTDKEIGFTGLSLGADGTLTAAGATFPSLWHIDLGSARASRIAAAATGADARCETSRAARDRRAI